MRRAALMLLVVLGVLLAVQSAFGANGPVVIAEISGPITPATDEYLSSSLRRASELDARLFILRLNTPGGLLPSMQKMVESLLRAPLPTVVYVSPQGGAALSAGVFITLAGNFAVMAPGTTIGAAHPVLGGGGDIQGDMREKIENYAVSLGRAIGEQRGRNVKWIEDAVRESISATDREAVADKVIDFLASDIDRILEELEGRSVTVEGKTVTLSGLATAPREQIETTLRQRIVAFLADPNIAMLLGLGALLGIAVELLHPGAVLPAIFGAVCLVLALVAGQLLPINTGGLLLLLLGAAFLLVEAFMPAFGIWGVAGIVCFVLGSIYFVDSEQVWASSGMSVDQTLIGSVGSAAALLIVGISTLALRAQSDPVKTGKEALIGRDVTALTDFVADEAGGLWQGKARLSGEIWQARLPVDGGEPPKAGETLRVAAVSSLVLIVQRKQ